MFFDIAGFNFGNADPWESPPGLVTYLSAIPLSCLSWYCNAACKILPKQFVEMSKRTFYIWMLSLDIILRLAGLVEESN